MCRYINCRLNGSYEALEAGNIADALVDFTGGVCESTSLQETGFNEDEDGRLAYFKTMQKAMGERSLIGASISVCFVSKHLNHICQSFLKQVPKTLVLLLLRFTKLLRRFPSIGGMSENVPTIWEHCPMCQKIFNEKCSYKDTPRFRLFNHLQGDSF